MGATRVNRVAFVCGCGIGQVGDRGHLPTRDENLKAGQAWDGKTFLDVLEGESPKCPNLANHPGQKPPTEVDLLRDELTALKAQLAGGDPHA